MALKYTYLRELPQNVIELAQRNHARMVKDSGKYKPLKEMKLVQDLPNKKISDLEDSLDWSMYHFLHGLQNGTINVPHYVHYDLLDEDDFYIMTFEEIRNWLYDFWENNPNEDDEEEEQKENLEEIEAITCPSYLNDRLGGIGYAMDEIKLEMESVI